MIPMDRILLEHEDLAVMEAHLVRAYPEEGCGVLLGRDLDGTRRVEAVVGVDNVHGESRNDRYEIHPERFLEIEKRARDMGVEVIGFFHSHPDRPAEPSRFDRERAWAYYSYMIASVTSGGVREIRSWRLREDDSRFDPENLVVVDTLPEAASGNESR